MICNKCDYFCLARTVDSKQKILKYKPEIKHQQKSKYRDSAKQLKECSQSGTYCHVYSFYHQQYNYLRDLLLRESHLKLPIKLDYLVNIY